MSQVVKSSSRVEYKDMFYTVDTEPADGLVIQGINRHGMDGPCFTATFGIR